MKKEQRAAATPAKPSPSKTKNPNTQLNKKQAQSTNGANPEKTQNKGRTAPGQSTAAGKKPTAAVSSTRCYIFFDSSSYEKTFYRVRPCPSPMPLQLSLRDKSAQQTATQLHPSLSGENQHRKLERLDKATLQDPNQIRVPGNSQ